MRSRHLPEHVAMVFCRLLLVMLLIGTLGADGASFKMGADWPRIAERDQTALITHADGRQRMALAVRLDLAASESGIWLVPVRGRPDQVKIDLARDMPWMLGGVVDPPRAAARRLIDTTAVVTALLAPGVPFLISPLLIPNLLLESRGSAAGMDDTTIRADGLAATVLPGEAPAQLALRLAGLGRAVPAERLAGFAPYADGDHSIIAVRLDPDAQADPDRWQGRAPALLLDFPSAGPWFPLRASIGGGHTRVHLQLAGWWTSPVATRGRQAVVPIWQPRWMHRYMPTNESGPDGVSDGQAAVCSWLGLDPKLPTQRMTRVELRLEKDADFADDLAFKQDQRPALTLERGMLVMGIPDWGWYVWILVLGMGALSGASFSRLLLGSARWGLLAGSTMAIGGGFAPWLVARFRCGNRTKRPSPLHLGTFVLFTIVLVPVCGMASVMIQVPAMEDGWVPIVALAGLATLAGLHVAGWCWWARSGKPDDQTMVLRGLAAWAYATPSAVIAMLALLAAIGLLWLEGRWL